MMCSRNINFSLQFSSTLHSNSIDIVHAFTRRSAHQFYFLWNEMNRYSFYPFIAYRIVFNLFSCSKYLF